MIDKREAIVKLELMRCNSRWNKHFNKALDCAIKVLRQMESEDCISRQEVLEVIEGVDWYHVNPKGELVHGSTSDEESWYKAEDIYEAIESLPPVTQKQITGKLESVKNATLEGEESTMNQPKSKLDCISRQEAIEAVPLVTVREILRSLPPVTPTERTGEWVDRQEGTFCSECDYKTNEYHNFCPNCGADMKGGKE